MTSDHVFSPPNAPAGQAGSDSETLRRAGEMGFTTLLLLAANACCGFLIFLAPITGAMALLQVRGVTPVTEVDHLWLRFARAGGWMGVILGGGACVLLVGYILFLVAIVMMDFGTSGALSAL